MPHEYQHQFRDRFEAGRELSALLEPYRGRDDVIVLGLPRGGVQVASAVADQLGAPLDVFIVRKLGVPGHPELAMGAIASGEVRVLNREVTAVAGITEQTLDDVTRLEMTELERREREYRGGRPSLDLQGKTVILVDDGLATGATMLAAVEAVRHLNPERVVAAVPVASEQTCRELRVFADVVACLNTPEPFFAVGAWYEDFDQVTDDEVKRLLRGAGRAFTR